jgi:hypothetical protein
MTREGVVLGTPEYMAPEQARGAVMDGRADLYGVGCLAYHMLTGCQLFAGGSYADVMVRHVKEAPPPPRTLNPHLSEELERAVLRCLAKEPAERPASALALAEELCAAVGRGLSPAPTSSTSRARPVVDAAPSAGVSAVISRTLKMNVGGRRKMVAGLAAGLALAAALALWVSPRSRVKPASATRPSAAGPGLQKLVQVRLQSMPSGATVTENGVPLGITPYDLSAAPGSDHTVEFSLAGHQRARQTFRADVDTTLAAVLEPADSQVKPAPQTPYPERARRRSARRGVTLGATPGGTDRDLDSRARTINPFAR